MEGHRRVPITNIINPFLQICYTISLGKEIIEAKKVRCIFNLELFFYDCTLLVLVIKKQRSKENGSWSKKLLPNRQISSVSVFEMSLALAQ